MKERKKGRKKRERGLEKDETGRKDSGAKKG